MSSIAGDRGKKENYLYAASKAALNVYLSGKRSELYKTNIDILTVKLGLVDTKMINKKKYSSMIISKPEIIAKRVFNLQQKSADVAYVPSYWRIIMFIIKMIPEKIFKKINF